MPKRLAVIVSQAQSSHPAKRQLEEDVIAGLLFEPDIDVTVVPHLYDLTADSTGMLALRGITGDVVVCSWLFERATRWVLDRNQISGHPGTSLLVSEADEDEDEEEEELEEETKPRLIDHRSIPNRKIYCLDFKVDQAAKPYIDEIKRIQAELSVQVVSLGGLGASSNGASSNLTPGSSNGVTPEQQARFENPTNTTSLPLSHDSPATENGQSPSEATVQRIEDQAGRRWYPVIDYSRCTNCLECIDFCLFGVYGVDKIDSILVEQPDNCRKGCPACSRVCPENAIIFPQHKTPAIAGSQELGSSLKIDLSQLFGAPESNKSAEEIAAQERDEQLLLAGREAVGMDVGMPKRQQAKAEQPRDELDDLVDELDELDI